MSNRAIGEANRPGVEDLNDRVAVVGMGPVGMTAALALARQGIEIVVFEAGSSLALESRASTFQPATLNILHELGVAEPLVNSGVQAPIVQYRTWQGDVIAEYDFAVLADETKFPFRLQNEQFRLTEIILTELCKLDHVELRFDSPLQRVELTGELVKLFVGQPGFESEILAPWVIAADGGSSSARKSLGLAFDGYTYPRRFLMVSTEYDPSSDFPDISPVTYLFGPEGWMLLLRLTNYWRATLEVPDDVSDEEALEERAVMDSFDLLSPKVSRAGFLHATIYRVHQRVASRFGAGRLLLAGDAAHANNPLGGLGMNSGIQDAWAAITAIQAARAGGDPERSVATYDRVRRHAALQHVQSQSDRNYRDLQEQDPEARAEIMARMRRIQADPKLMRSHLQTMSLLSSAKRSENWLRRDLLPPRKTPRRPAGAELSEALGKGQLRGKYWDEHSASGLPSEDCLALYFVIGAPTVHSSMPDVLRTLHQALVPAQQAYELGWLPIVSLAMDWFELFPTASVTSLLEREHVAAVELVDGTDDNGYLTLADRVVPTLAHIAQNRQDLLVIGRFASELFECELSASDVPLESMTEVDMISVTASGWPRFPSIYIAEMPRPLHAEALKLLSATNSSLIIDG